MKYITIDCTSSFETPAKAIGKTGYFDHRAMTVGELIEELQDYDEDTRVLICTGQGELRPVNYGNFSYEEDCYPENLEDEAV